MTAKSLQDAVQKAASLPEPAQDQLGREVLARIEALERLRGDVAVGLAELDAGQGEEVDVEALIRQARAEHGGA